MTVNESKNFNIKITNEEMKSAQVVNKVLESMQSLTEDEELYHIETDDVLSAGDIEKAQEVLRIVFSYSEGNWQ